MDDSQWHLAIDLRQPLSEGSVMLDPERGIILIPFATQQSVHVAAGRLRLGIIPASSYLQGEVIKDHEADPGRIQAIANTADYEVP